MKLQPRLEDGLALHYPPHFCRREVPGQRGRLWDGSRCSESCHPSIVSPPSPPSPPQEPHPGFVPVLIIALLLFSVRYNSGIFYNLDLFIDTRFLYKDLYIK